MDRRVVATVAVVVVLSLAGCSALPAFDQDQTPAATPSPTATTTPSATPTPTATPTPQDPANVDYPDGYGPDGIEDPDAAARTHVDALVGADSYRFRFDVGVGSGNGTEDAFVYLLSVDQANETALEIRDDGDATRYQYYENDRLYLRLVVDGDEQYNATDTEFVPEQFTGSQYLGPLFEHVEYGTPETVDTDNGTLHRYRSENVTDPDAILPGNATEAEIASFTVQLVVHEDGYVRGARYIVVTENGSELAAVALVEDVNAETVTRPEWYDRAAEG
ncbi:DUF7537 family lipoprotein [Natronomonas marina]|jgi:hypothetical protein|uniref:DUF7537 family lipoprotein n=1 Tax=Natronomonas marina TaxID=2961939 RepID=UPI0020C9C913|nr:hypothetical protein [Natronomonas marina]